MEFKKWNDFRKRSGRERENTAFCRLCNVKDAVEAQLAIKILKDNGIAAYTQDAAPGAGMYTTSGFGLYGVDIYIEEKNAERAAELVKNM